MGQILPSTERISTLTMEAFFLEIINVANQSDVTRNFAGLCFYFIKYARRP